MIFRVIKGEVELESQLCTTFGIAVVSNNGEEQIFLDISFNFEEVNEFVNELNTHNPETVHIGDLIEDFINK